MAVSFNSSELLVDAIRSVMAQSFSDFEVVLIDHGFRDSTVRLCSSFMGDNRFKYHKVEECSLAKARNEGVSRAGGEQVIYLNYDDTFPGDALEVLVKEQQKGFAGTYANMNLMDRSGKVYETRKSRRFECQEDAAWALLSEIRVPILTPTLMARREVLKECPSDENVGTVEDVEVLLHILQRYPLHYTDHTVHNFRIHNGNYLARTRLDTIGWWNQIYERYVNHSSVKAYLKAKRAGVIIGKYSYETTRNLIWRR